MEITRGNNKTFKFQRKREDESVITELPKQMYITFKNDEYEKDALFQKRLNNGTIEYSKSDNYYRFEIVPEDTDDLDYGNYFFDITIRNNHNKKITIKKGYLAVTKSSTHKENEVK